jgi:hypothetical protein
MNPSISLYVKSDSGWVEHEQRAQSRHAKGVTVWDSERTTINRLFPFLGLLPALLKKSEPAPDFYRQLKALVMHFFAF